MGLPVMYIDLSFHQRRLVREEYIRLQNGNCFYCKKTLETFAPKFITDKPIVWSAFPENFMNYPVHLHHNHETGLTEGAVHNYCNAVLWQYEGK